MALTSTRTVMSDGGKAAKPKYNDEVLKKIAEELEYAAGRASNIVFVSDYIYSDADIYDELSESYRGGLGYIDRALAGVCDRVTEVAYGQIIDYKR